MQIRVLTNN